jgi:hypothetical protein
LKILDECGRLEGKRGDNGGGSYTLHFKGRPGQCPLVLLVQEPFREGKVLGNEEGKVLGGGFGHGAEEGI